MPPPAHCRQDNDIVLCDGPCNRAYHCKCIVPPLDVSTLTEDEGWLCPACDHKVSRGGAGAWAVLMTSGFHDSIRGPWVACPGGVY